MPDDLKAKLENCGRVQFDIAEAALFCEITQDRITEDQELCTAFMRGRVQAEYVARSKILQSAREGDLSACRQLLQLAERSRPDIDYGDDD